MCQAPKAQMSTWDVRLKALHVKGPSPEAKGTSTSTKGPSPNARMTAWGEKMLADHASEEAVTRKIWKKRLQLNAKIIINNNNNNSF